MDGYIRIEREGTGFEVTVWDPAIAKSNKDNDAWTDPCAEYQFDTWAQVSDFLDQVYEKALPESDYSRSFDKIAKEVMSDD